MRVERPPRTMTVASAVRGLLLMAALLLWLGPAGCSYLAPEKLPYAKLAVPYAGTQLGTSTTLDVLNIARSPAYQFDANDVDAALLTQSDRVIAYSGRSDDRRKAWVNMIAFDEYRLTAKRKYFVLVDERAEVAPGEKKHVLFPPRKGMRFDSEFVIDPEILTTPYATEETQKIAIIQWLSEQFKDDLASLVGDPQDPAQGSDAVLISGAMVRQMLTGLLIELDKSPGVARNLGNARGVAFPHINLGEGRIRMLVVNDVAAVTVRVNLPMAP